MFIWLIPIGIKCQEVLLDSIPEEQKIFTKAVELIDSAKYQEAIPLLKTAIKQKKDFWQAYNKMAYCKIKLKDYKGAEKDLKKAELIMPINFETTKLKGINFYLFNKFSESKGAIDSAIEISIDEKIDDWELFYYRALLMYKGKAYKTALEALESVTDLNPNCIEAIVLKAEIRFLRKEYNYAIKELNEAIKKMPLETPDYKAYKLRAKARFENKDFKDAITDWNVYLDGFPGEEEALISRAAAKINTKDYTGAIVDLDEAIKKNAKNPVSYCYRAVAKSENKAFQEALKDYDMSLKLKFDYADAFYNRAATKMAIKDKFGACEDLNKADGLGNVHAAQIIEKYCK
ncbi:MAG: tetratricopeptide repeat protein [Bacteroidota bacterium]|nr:tetratricopeptide repeat protein [Bacteroidota bacterium]MDP3145715.1 tetratricopeptide repeat protein [Bacteroidota bacterium]MDP3558408.1 tetratricopeptide repeat protein [Bacteroidota bacterium]